MLLYALLIPAVPLAAFVIQVFFGRRLPRGGDWVSLSAIVLAFFFSLPFFTQALSAAHPDFRISFGRWTWLDLGTTQIAVGLLVDNITAIMLMVVTLVSGLVHFYSVGYMHGDPRYSRFFGFLSLFSFSMLGLILCDNFLLLYLFWELVGLSSYLLIGFWYEKPSAAAACKKAFLVNRVGDLGFFVGILILFWKLGVLDFDGVFSGIAQGKLGGSLLTAAGLCLFCGAVGKSAQFPLHVWLPDAMEGPTPVSALIHAATMVAAGVYMVTRMFPILTPDALVVIAYIGAITAMLGATIAVAQYDIKRVLAYSTVSQLGYMIMGLGVGAYAAGFFHLMTHAAFKACLFLGSGSVIHAMHHVFRHTGSKEDPQDMRNMGGLKDKMPITFWTFAIATVSLAGVPFTSGFLSKDAILAGALGFGFFDHSRHILIPLFGFAAAGLTAFYMFRLIFMTFYGSPKDRKVVELAHESPRVMTVPLIVLATLSLWFWYSPNPIGEGWFHTLIQEPQSIAMMGESDSVGQIQTVAGTSHGEAHTDSAHRAHYPAMALSILIAGGGIYLAYRRYYGRQAEMMAWEEAEIGRNRLFRALHNKWYFR